MTVATIARALVALLLATTVGLVGAVAAADPPDLWRRSYALEARGEPLAALEVLEELPASERAGYLYTVRRAWLLHLAGRHQESVGAYHQAIEAAPAAVEPRVGILGPLIALRRFQDAEAEARRALALDRDNHGASRSLAWILYNLGRFEEAEAVYRRVLALHPSDLDMRAGVGWCLLRRGRREEALREFREVLRVAPDNAAARAGLEAPAPP